MEIVKELPETDYKKVLNSVPIVCIDLIVQNKGGKVLLVKRKEKPAQGEWWFPGGRLFKNEMITDCIKRKLYDEVGLETDESTFVDAYETIFDDGPFDSQSHTINLTYLVIAKGDASVFLNDRYASDYRWVSGYEDFISEYVKRAILAADETW